MSEDSAAEQQFRAISNPDELVSQTGALARGFRRLPDALPYIRPYRKLAGVSVGLIALLAIVGLAEPWPLAFLIDGVLGAEEVPGWVTGIVGTGTTGLILFAVGLSLLITLLSGALNIFNEYITTKVQLRMVLDLRSDLFAHAQRLSLSYHDDSEMGVMMYKINNQATALGSIVVAIPSVVLSLFQIVGMGFIAYRIDRTLALVALIVIPLVSYSTRYYANRVEPELLRVRGMEGKNLTIVHESLAMLRVILAFGRSRHEYGRFRKQGEETVEARVKLTVKQTLFRLAVNLMTSAGTAAVLGVGAARVLDGHLSVGQLLVMMSYIAAVYQPLTQLTATIAGFQQFFIALDHALDILETPVDVVEREDALTLAPVTGHVSIRNVSFAYDGRDATLKDMSIEVPAGSTLAIVGPTGAGKSTLVSLLSRFYDPDEGQILIDGVDIRDATLESLRSQFSVVLQEPLLFSGSIGDNILYGRPDASMDEVRDAARNANAHKFIRTLPSRYSTQLGEGGTKVSGGERQRIAIARAFLRDAPILLLDEPTSAIDSKTESVIVDALERLMEGRTTVLIAHRLSMVRTADQIVVVDGGAVSEVGTHNELLRAQGLYAELWEAQTGETIDLSASDQAVAADSESSVSLKQRIDRLSTMLSAEQSGAGHTDRKQQKPPKKKSGKMFEAALTDGSLDHINKALEQSGRTWADLLEAQARASWSESTEPSQKHWLTANVDLTVRSKGPITLSDDTTEALRSSPFMSRDYDGSLPTPDVSVIVVTHGNLILSRMAIESVLQNSGGVNIELIVVDNGSTEEVDDLLLNLSLADQRLSVLKNRSNLGFARANNQGFKAARADKIVLLNNDTIVPPGWLNPLLAELADPTVGLVGPTTNRSGTGAEIDCDYQTYDEMVSFAEAIQLSSKRGWDIGVSAMFCTALRRSTFELVGPLDERFGLGMFEDDDYSVRVRNAGLRVVCADNAFVHHFGQGSLSVLAAEGIYGDLFRDNRTMFENKWGIQWVPHKKRPSENYSAFCKKLHDGLRRGIPKGSTIALLSRGDERIVDLDDYTMLHFPLDKAGNYQGHHPRDDAAAIAALDGAARSGAQYLVVPEYSAWWFEYYPGFTRYLEEFSAVDVSADGLGRIFLLDQRANLSEKSSERLTG